MKHKESRRLIKILVFIVVMFFSCGLEGMSVEAAIKNEWESVDCEDSVSRLAYGKGRFVGISDDGYTMYSEDGYDWIKGQNIGTVGNLIYCGDYFFIYSTSDSSYISADGISWKSIHIGGEYDSIQGICYYNGTYYAFVNEMLYGGAGLNLGWISYIYASDDGVQWNYKMMDKGATHEVSVVGNDKWITFGKQNVEQYSNACFRWTGFAWEYVAKIGGIVDGVYGNSGFAVVSSGGNIYASKDGQSWSLEANIGTSGDYKIIYGKNHYIACNEGGELFVKNATDSTNTTWRTMDLDTYTYDIAYGEGKILVSTYSNGLMVNETGAGANAYLSDLQFINGKLSENFTQGKLNYQLKIPHSVSKLGIVPTLAESGGKILLGKDGTEEEISSDKTTYLAIGDDEESFYLKVIAENGVTYKKYSFEVERNEQYLIEAESTMGGTVYGGGYGECGEEIALSAVPAAGYEFAGWYENETLYSIEESITITVTDRERKFTPVFQLIQNDEFTIVLDSETVCPGNSYLVKAINANGEECQCEFEILNGVKSSIYQSYTDEEYYLYVDYYEKTDALMIKATLTSDDTIQATIRVPVLYETVTYQVQGECVPKEAGVINGGGIVEQGQSVLISAEENPGYIFKNWNLDNQFYSDEKDLIISDVQADYSLEAIYEKLALSSIGIKKQPIKLVYYEGDVFETDGMKVVAYYNNGSSKEIYNYTVDKTTSLEVGDNRIVISYVEDGVEKTVDLSIQVLEKDNNDGDDSTEDDKKEDTTEPPEEENGNEGTQQPSTEEGGNEETQQPSTEEGGNEETQQPPVEESGNEETQQPPVEEGGNEETQQPPAEEDGSNTQVETPAGGGTNAGKETTYKLNQKITKGNLTYQIVKLKNKTGSVSVIKAKKNLKSVVIPDQIKVNGYTFKVTQVGKKAFYNQKKLAKVTIGKNMKTINQYAFAKCKKLKTINIKSTSITKVGKNAFLGIHKKNQVKIPKKCKKKYATWMKKNKLNMR